MKTPNPTVALTAKAIPLSEIDVERLPSLFDLRDLAIGPDEMVYLLEDNKSGSLRLPAGCERVFSPRNEEDGTSFVTRGPVPRAFANAVLESMFGDDYGRAIITGGVSGNTAYVHQLRLSKDGNGDLDTRHTYVILYPTPPKDAKVLSRSVPFKKNDAGSMEPFGFQEIELADGSTESVDVPAVEVDLDTYETLLETKSHALPGENTVGAALDGLTPDQVDVVDDATPDTAALAAGSVISTDDGITVAATGLDPDAAIAEIARLAGTADNDDKAGAPVDDTDANPTEGPNPPHAD